MKTVCMTDIPNIAPQTAHFIIRSANSCFKFETDDYSVDRFLNERRIQLFVKEKDLRPFFKPEKDEIFSITEILNGEEYFYPNMVSGEVDFYSKRHCDGKSCSSLHFVSNESRYY